MNIMRKLWVGGSGGGGNGQSSGGGQQTDQSISLGLMHLRKLFTDYLHMPSDDKIYNMLPLFCKVFASSSSTDMIEKFPEINTFCQVVSKLMVCQVRKRASNQSTEDAAVSIVKFLEAAGQTDEDSRGWTLIMTLNILSAGDQNLVDIMTAASVPSTLVKSLYIFFDLPEIPQVETPKVPTSATEISQIERRMLLQKIFVQVLVRICSYPAPAEELAKKDDLTLLFSAVTSWCPPYNAIWRKSAADVLMTISCHGLTPAVLSYIHNKGCLSLCVDNLKQVGKCGQEQLIPLEITEMVFTIFSFLKDSSEFSQVLLDDFKSGMGYHFLTEILLSLETDQTSESQEAIRKLTLVIASLTFCGLQPLKPNMANINSLFPLPQFQLPTPGTKGESVRNFAAFQVLQNVFTKSTTHFLSSIVLDAISSIFKSDHSNYFIVDSVLPQMAEKLLLKSPEIQQSFLEIVEFIVFQLQFTPCKELIAISRILKNDLSESLEGQVLTKENLADIEKEIHLKILCVRMLQNLAKHNVLFKDVFREVGILEVLVTCLHRFCSDICQNDLKNDSNKNKKDPSKDELGSCVIDVLTVLLSGNNPNVNIFRENNGSKSILKIVKNYTPMRSIALGLMQQLLMSQGGEEDMTSLLVTLHSSDLESNIALKSEILTNLHGCFSSHRARCNFRRAGGFIYLMSLIVSMEGLLQKYDTSSHILRELMLLIHLIFTCFALAMRFEPGNAKLFQQEICLPSLSDSLKLLGCFSNEKQIISSTANNSEVQKSSKIEEILQQFQSIFQSFQTTTNFNDNEKIPFTFIFIIFLYRLLYDLTTDSFEKNVLSSPFPNLRSPRKQQSSELSADSSTVSTPTSPNPAVKKNQMLSLIPATPEPTIIHSAALIVMVRLIPSIIQTENSNQNLNSNQTQDMVSYACQIFCAELVKSLVRNERNQQIMAQAQFTEEILESCSVALADESHFLYSPIHYSFERVATHLLNPKDLRRYLRLGNPLNCERIPQHPANNSTINPILSVPLSRIKSLVSMTTPKSNHHHHSGCGSGSSGSLHANYPLTASTFPPFVEFDMSPEGFGCLFLPSVAPHNYNTGPEFGATSILTSGMGENRVFPGASLSYSTWFCVNKYSDPRQDPHPVRILTILRESNNLQKLCLSILISARDKALIISTRETQLPPQGIGDWEPDIIANSSVRVWCPDLLNENQWHHLFLVFTPSSSHSFTLYVNGRGAHVGKFDYPHRTKGSIYLAYIGSPPIWRKSSRLSWKQGVCHLFEDWAPNSTQVAAIWKLGPEYPGSWQSIKIHSETNGVLVGEDKIIFGINALAISQLTLAKIRKIYTKFDAKNIAKQLGLSSTENATPISILHNSAAHLVGHGRSLGGIAIGHLGIRIFSPCPVAKSILSVGGVPILIGLIGLASTGEMLYAALKALVCVVKSQNTQGINGTTSLVDTTSCWQMLGYLLKKKKHLLSIRVLHLVFNLVSFDHSLNRLYILDGNCKNSGFNELLGDLDIWCHGPLNSVGRDLHYSSGSSSPIMKVQQQQGEKDSLFAESPQEKTIIDFPSPSPSSSSTLADLEKALYEHFLQTLNEEPKIALEILRESGIVQKLLRRLTFSESSAGNINQPSIFLLLSHLLSHKGTSASVIDLIHFGHFIVGTLPPSTPNERESYLTESIELRNKSLQLLHSLMYTGKVLNVGFCEEIVARLGFDFILLFAAPNLHPSTLLWTLRILLLLITSSSNLKTKFRDGSPSAFCFGRTVNIGGRLNSSSVIPLKRQDTKDEDEVLGQAVTVASILKGKPDYYPSGWARLSWLLAQRCEDIKTEGSEILPNEVWLILCAMILGQPCRNISMNTDTDQLTLDLIWGYVFAVPSNRMTSSLYGKVTLCPDAILTILTLIRCYITAETPLISSLLAQSHSAPNASPMSNQSDVASCVIQFLCYLYSNTPEFQIFFTSTEILNSLAATVIPIEVVKLVNEMDIDYTCEEVKAFPDSEPLILLKNPKEDENENKSEEEQIHILEKVEVGEEAEAEKIETENFNDKINLIPSPPISATTTTTTSAKIGEVPPVGMFDYSPNRERQNDENLMNHPCKKIILDFLRMVIIDWMSTSSSQVKSGININTVIDTVLEAGSSDFRDTGVGEIRENGVSSNLIAQYHTNILGTLLDHLIAFDLERMTSYLPAVASFISRVVDKLWLQSFIRDPQVILDYILVLVNFCKNKRIPPSTTDLIYNSLNRVILFILSRKSKRWDKVEALKKLKGLRSVIFGSGNHQQEFFGCLVHVLIQLAEGLPITLESNNRTQWHVPVSLSDEELNEKVEFGGSIIQKNSKESYKLNSEISSTAEKVWEDLFISKKPLVEELFKISFQSPQPPSLSSLKDQIGDIANKLWLLYVANETSGIKKSGSNQVAITQSWEIHQQLYRVFMSNDISKTSKLQKVTGGLSRLAGRSGIGRKDSEKEKTIRDLLSQWEDAKRAQNNSIKHIGIIKDALESQERFHMDNLRHLHRYVRDTLLPQLENELTRERGLWGNLHPSHLDKWMMDTCEGPCRMRKKLMRNDMFYVHYPYHAENQVRTVSNNDSLGGSVSSSPKARRINPPISHDSKEFYKKFKHQTSLISEICNSSVSSMEDVEEISQMAIAGSTSSDPNDGSPKNNNNNNLQMSMDDPFADGSCDNDPDNQSMLFRHIGSNTEKITQIFRVAHIQGLDTTEGLLLFGKEHFYLVSGFTILAKTREIKDMYYLPANMYETILPNQCYGNGPSPAKPRSKTHVCWKFLYDDIKEVHKRRYLLQPIALEIFCSDGRNYLLAFPRKVRNVVYQKFTSVSKNITDNHDLSVAGQKRTASVEQSTSLFSSLIGETSVTQRWVRGEISNFQYLMHLNTLAGRSYNDLMQYPVFPWILADYESHFLDLHDPNTFRDLSKPMGAQSNNRLSQFVKRFKEWDDPHGETPPYHYGTHYSSAMIVCSYLVRMEPFAQHFLRLQGGHFDLADRMFHSIKEAWVSASKQNMADVKELIPEFFYLPEFLVNSNNFDLGSKQNGIQLNNVLLPPWAKGDSREFIRVHRMALESDYVSQHLHSWIDLIFGYKQQGLASVEAVNVFHHLFYEGNVDIYNIDDPLKKNATIGFINNFGQIPKQLFKKAHPVKKANPTGKFYNLGILENPNPLVALANSATSGNSNQGNPGEKLFYHHVECLRPTLNPIKELKGPIGQIHPLERANAIIAVEQNKFLLSTSRYISWGFADCSLRVCTIETDRPLFIWEQTQQQQWNNNIGEIVSCTTSSDKIAITGNTNTLVSVWDVMEKELRLKGHLYGHTEAITCLTCSSHYNIIVSGSKDTTAIVWDLARLTFVRQLISHTSSGIDAVGVNELTGDIATCDGSWLRLWSINGESIGKIDTAGIGGNMGGNMNSGILCVTFSYLNEWDCDNVIVTGSTDGIVRMWSIRYVQTQKGGVEKISSEVQNTAAAVKVPSFEDDSSIVTEGADSQEINDDDDDPEMELLTEVFESSRTDPTDPDKDRDSLEDGNIPSKIDNQQCTKIEESKFETEDDAFENKEELEEKSEHISPLPSSSTPPATASASPISTKGVVRRQRALSSGTSVSKSSIDAEAKKAKRKSDIPKEIKNSTSSVGDKSRHIRGSKSENSLSFDADDSFEVVSENDLANLRSEERKAKIGGEILMAHQLKEGFIWERKIIFRGKLTMHTAYDRKENPEPASITALIVSKDHKKIFVGDARGRVYSWAVSDNIVRGGENWNKDESYDVCGNCKTNISFSDRIQCKSCGGYYCAKCTKFESEIFRLKILRPVKVCQPCFIQLKGRLLSTSSETYE